MRTLNKSRACPVLDTGMDLFRVFLILFGALAIGDVKYKVHKKIFEEMISADDALYFEHSTVFPGST